ncbi:hypothetical protein, partial [Bifidobacterium angulatum]|uniref:hypothetical protein n=1 Tax=Bifidobacterium angulatum TaxID=1683 RepID=UPI0034A2F166
HSAVRATLAPGPLRKACGFHYQEFSTIGDLSLKVGSINSIFYFLHKAAEPFNCLEQDNLA